MSVTGSYTGNEPRKYISEALAKVSGIFSVSFRRFMFFF